MPSRLFSVLGLLCCRATGVFVRVLSTKRSSNCIVTLRVELGHQQGLTNHIGSGGVNVVVGNVVPSAFADQRQALFVMLEYRPQAGLLLFY